MAPILFLCFNRPHHARESLAALLTAIEPGSRTVFVRQDGPRGAHEAAAVAQTTAVVRELLAGWSGRSDLRCAEQNLGLAAMEVGSIGEILAAHEAILVFEDDIVVARETLVWLDTALTAYADDARVGAVQCYFPPGASDRQQGFFLRGSDSWGWGTWKRAWSCYDNDAVRQKRLLEEQGLTRPFDHGSQANWWGTMRHTVAGRRNSWAVRWRASLFLRGMLSLYPPYPMIRNIGHDGSGEHCTITSTYTSSLPRTVPGLPDTVAEDVAAKEQLERWHRVHNSFGVRLRNRLRTIFIKRFGLRR